MPFLCLYVWRLTNEGRQMSAALAATEHVLAREQKLHALDGLAAAAAHELGTPLSTITLVTTELDRQLPMDSPLREDIVLLRSQAQRCREILQKLTRHPEDQDPLHSSLSVAEMLHEAAAPYLGTRAQISHFGCTDCRYCGSRRAPTSRGSATRRHIRPGQYHRERCRLCRYQGGHPVGMGPAQGYGRDRR